MRMGLINVQLDNAKLEDTAILLSHKSDRGGDNDEDLRLSTGTEDAELM